MGDPFGMEDGTSWNPASVDMPPMPTIPPGEDGLSMTIAAVMPTLSAPLAANVTALQAKETMFSGKVDSAKSAYQNADDQGNQGIGQIGQMLGQVGQMAQQAGKAGEGGGGGSSIFGSLMEQAMKAAQGGGSKDGGSQGADVHAADQSQAGSPAAGQPAASQAAGGQGPAGGAAGAQQQPSREGEGNRQDQTPPHDRDAIAHEAPAEQPPAEAAGPGERQHNAGPAPVGPPVPTRHGDEDLSRRM